MVVIEFVIWLYFYSSYSYMQLVIHIILLKPWLWWSMTDYDGQWQLLTIIIKACMSNIICMHAASYYKLNYSHIMNNYKFNWITTICNVIYPYPCYMSYIYNGFIYSNYGIMSLNIWVNMHLGQCSYIRVSWLWFSEIL